MEGLLEWEFAPPLNTETQRQKGMAQELDKTCRGRNLENNLACVKSL